MVDQYNILACAMAHHSLKLLHYFDLLNSVIQSISKLLQPAPFISQIADKKTVQVMYQSWRLRICFFLFLGYASYYLTRKSYTYVMQYLAIDLGLSKGELGLIGTSLYITYGISKFYSGAISDRSNPRYFMAFGLIATGLCNIAIGFSSSFTMIAIFWGLNGWFQAWGWPACCKCFTYWFEKTSRGRAYSVCLTSQNVGSAIIPVMSILLAMSVNWRLALFLPAGISIVMGGILIYGLRDVPQTLGLPPIETDQQGSDASKMLSIKSIMLEHVLVSRMVWMVAIANFFVYFIRTAITDWGVIYLIETQHFSDPFAASTLSWFEVVGIAGMLLAGFLSDKYFKGNRIPVIVLSGLGMFASIIGLWYAPESIVWPCVLFFGILGFFLFAPQMIIGLAATEYVDKRASSAANGFAGTLGYLGAAVASAAIGFSIDWYGWEGYYITMLACSAFVFILLLPNWLATPKLAEAAS